MTWHHYHPANRMHWFTEHDIALRSVSPMVGRCVHCVRITFFIFSSHSLQFIYPHCTSIKIERRVCGDGDSPFSLLSFDALPRALDKIISIAYNRPNSAGPAHIISYWTSFSGHRQYQTLQNCVKTKVFVYSVSFFGRCFCAIIYTYTYIRE